MSALSRDKERRLLSLAAAVCDETIAAEGITELEAIIAASPETALWYVRWMDLHFELHAQLPLHASSANKLPVDIAEPRRSWLRLIRPTPLSFGIAALVLGVLVTAMAFIAAPFYRELRQIGLEPEAATAVVAQITDEHEAQWAEGQIGGRLGAFLTADRQLHLLSGKAELTFRSGAKVLLEGPCEFTAISPTQGKLAAGKLVARVADDTRGFVVETPTSIVTDLGTEFGVAVDDQGNTDVEVFEGSVTAQLQGSEETPLVLHSGEAARVDLAAGVRRIAGEHSIAFDRGLYGPESDADSLVRNGSFEVATLSEGSGMPGVYDLRVEGNTLAGWNLHGSGNWIMRADSPDLTHGSPSHGTTFLNVTGPHPRYGNKPFQISQRIATQSGKTYVVQFDLAARPRVTERESLTISAGKESHEYFARDLPAATNCPASYAARSFTFVAAASETLISIKGPATPMFGFYFDNIRIVEQRSGASVPATAD